jgi:predicted PurR-regulated permease PerM
MTADTKPAKTFVERVFIAAGVTVLTVLVLLLLYFALDVVLLVFAAALIAIFLRGLAEVVSRNLKIPEGWSVLLVSIFLVAILAGAIALLAPSVGEQVRHLRDELPRSAQQAGEYISQFGWGRTLIEQLPSPDELMQKVSMSTLLTNVGGYFSSTIGAIGNFFIVILLAIYLASEPQFYAKGFTKLFPVRSRPRVKEVLAGISETLEWWLIGKAASMLFIGLLTWIGLSILGVPLALTLGLIAGLLSFIPNFGPILSAVPAILLAFIESPISALYVLALYVGVQLVESNVVTPLIERETIELPPALTITFQLTLGIMIGGLGLVLATPMLAMILVIVQMVYIEDILGDRETEVLEKVGEEDIERKGSELLDEDRP